VATETRRSSALNFPLKVGLPLAEERVESSSSQLQIPIDSQWRRETNCPWTLRDFRFGVGVRPESAGGSFICIMKAPQYISENPAGLIESRETRVRPVFADAYVIGLKYGHHARHSGYSGFTRHVAAVVGMPFRFRWLSGRLGPLLDGFAAMLTGRPRVSLALLLMEMTTKLHMRSRRNTLYHVLHGDTDFSGRCRRVPFESRRRHLDVLSRGSRRTGNWIVATFHKPPSILCESVPERSVIRRLDAAILISEAQREYFDGLLAPEQIHVVHHGIDTDFFKPSSSVVDAPLCVTAGSYLRDFRCLADAMRIVWRVNPEVRLVAVGTRRYGDKYLRELGTERVEFLDGVSDETLRAAYQRARVAIFAFEDSTANNSLLEAMACGLPIVCTDVGGVKEYAGDDAYVPCPPQDAGALARGVLRVLDDAGLEGRLREASRARALAHDYRVVAAEMREVYAEVIAWSAARASRNGPSAQKRR